MATVRHVSIRAPWHDTDWTGRICSKPGANASCLVLPRIREERDDDLEESLAGEDWDTVPAETLPPCVRERVGFMRASEFSIPLTHPYATRGSEPHANLGTLTLRLPAYSAPAVPFRWMRQDEAEELAESEGLDYRPELEEEASNLMPFQSGWVQHGHNQETMLNGFFSTVKKNESLAFFYAKRVPLTEEEGRVLLGVARVASVSPPVRYGGDNPLGTLAWECMVQHTLRPGYADGFLLPYHEALAAAEDDPALDLDPFVAFAPDDAWLDFSYASEHVSADAAITSLVACERALRVAAEKLPGSRARELSWISERLGEIWELRGPCPGLASALQTFGVQHGTLFVRALESHFGPGIDPWDVVDEAMNDPAKFGDLVGGALGVNLPRKWTALPAERRSLLKLISRFNLTPQQAERWYQPSERQSEGIDYSDAEILSNPYVLYEGDRESENPIPVRTVDHGAFPTQSIRSAFPLPAPSAMEDPLDVRRVRALMVDRLERAAIAGNTLQAAPSVVLAVRHQELDPPCPLDEDQLLAYGNALAPEIIESQFADEDKTRAFQLNRLLGTKQVIQKFVDRRIEAPRHEATIDWRPLLDELLGGPASPSDVDELLAREEKVAALQELHASRFSVLIGPAGTGKTTLLKVLCDHPSVRGGNVLLLAPTGKARVRLGLALKAEAQTIAQFLLPSGRYAAKTMRYRMNDAAPEDGFKTVIIDEASMLTEEQLAAVLNGLKGVARFVLVGDPRQLPPIGAGRPFVDIVAKLRPEALDGAFPRIAPGCAELTVPRRPTSFEGVETNEAQRRADLMLSEWFSGRPPSPAADIIWDMLREGEVDPTLTVRRWYGPADLRETLLDVLEQELDLDGPDDILGFELSCGGSEHEGYAYFWPARGESEGAAARIEDWQILAPVKGHAWGVRDLNRSLQRRFRRRALEWAQKSGWGRKIPRPLGPEEIVWGDKVISVVNESWRRVYPEQGALRYVANGDIGVVVGQYRTRRLNRNPWKGEVEFAGQSGYVYDYRHRDFGDDGSPPLELAYALTVHKAQGSEFGRTILVIPNPCRILSRELLYTALTRQRERVTLLYQGDPNELKNFARPERSETARRVTNLFAEPSPVETEPGVFLERGLIHRTTRGDIVRSKSEALIAELLHGRGVDYAYERRLEFDDKSVRYPDFTIEDDDLGRTIYWEHLGMLNDPIYAERWEAKRQWYLSHGVVEYPAKGPEVLIHTRDDEAGGIDNQKIAAIIDDLLA